MLQKAPSNFEYMLSAPDPGGWDLEASRCRGWLERDHSVDCSQQPPLPRPGERGQGLGRESSEGDVRRYQGSQLDWCCMEGSWVVRKCQKGSEPGAF